jgi:hypothetical protein
MSTLAVGFLGCDESLRVYMYPMHVVTAQMRKAQIASPDKSKQDCSKRQTLSRFT